MRAHSLLYYQPFLIYFFLIIFISLGGINYFVATILKSFQYTEAISKLLTTSFLDSLLATLLFAITSAVEIALPLMGSLFIINFVLILIAKKRSAIKRFYECIRN
ncbi:flagellar biosynthetic protein FliR [Bacillus cereus]